MARNCTDLLFAVARAYIDGQISSDIFETSIYNILAKDMQSKFVGELYDDELRYKLQQYTEQLNDVLKAVYNLCFDLPCVKIKLEFDTKTNQLNVVSTRR